MIFKNTINGDFKEEFTSIKHFVKKTKKEMTRKAKISMIVWTIITTIVSLANIAVVVLAAIAIDVMYSSGKTLSSGDAFPVILVAVIAILTFVISIVVSIYQAIMKSRVYYDAAEDLQYLTIGYKTGGIKISEQEFKKQVSKIYSKALRHKKKLSLKTFLYKVFTGGNDE